MFNVLDNYSSLEPLEKDVSYTKQFETEQHDNFDSTMKIIINKLYGTFDYNPIKTIKHLLFYFFIFLENKGTRVKNNILSEHAHNSFISSSIKKLEEELDIKFEFEIKEAKISNEILILLHFMTVPKTYIDIISYTIKNNFNDSLDKYTENQIKIIKELIKVNVDDKICDPFNRYGTLLLELNNNNMLYGYCMNEDYEIISKLNTYVYNKFYKRDVKYSSIQTLHSLKENMDLLGYDIIVTKMPYEQNIKHAECCERVNKLKIRGTKCEPLYLQLLMTSLNRGGRCAVIVPKSLLIGDSSCHIQTRKYLLENFELKEIIGMEKNFILYFENTGKPSTTYTIKTGYYMRDDIYFALVNMSYSKSEEPMTQIIDVKELEHTTYNLLEIKKIEVVEIFEDVVCEKCANCIEKDKIIEDLKTKLKTIHDLSTVSNKIY